MLGSAGRGITVICKIQSPGHSARDSRVIRLGEASWKKNGGIFDFVQLRRALAATATGQAKLRTR
jgi:hypothetical protein